MLQTKVFELRDRATFIPIVCVEMLARYVEGGDPPAEEREGWLLWKAGYSLYTEPLILLTRLDGGKSAYDPYVWNDRTFQTAHDYIARSWNGLKSGDLIDVRVILGEATEPCETEQTP